MQRENVKSRHVRKLSALTIPKPNIPDRPRTSRSSRKASSKIFGIELHLLPLSTNNVPKFMVGTIRYIINASEEGDKDVKRLFKLDMKKIESDYFFHHCLKMAETHGVDECIAEADDLKIICWLLLHWLKDIPGQLVKTSIAKMLYQNNSIGNDEWRLVSCHSVLLLLPMLNRHILSYLVTSMAILIDILGEKSTMRICRAVGIYIFGDVIDESKSKKKRNDTKFKREIVKIKSNLFYYLMIHKDYLFKLEFPNIVFGKHTYSPNIVVLEADRISALNKLLDEYYRDPDYIDLFFKCHKYFISEEEILEWMLEEFNNSKGELEWKKNKRLRILMLFKIWLAEVPESSDEIYSILPTVETQSPEEVGFVDAICMFQYRSQESADSITDTQEEQDENSIFLKGDDDLRYAALLILLKDPKSFSEQLTLYEFELFRRISKNEIFNKEFLTTTKNSHFNNMVKHCNTLGYWIQTMIVMDFDKQMKCSEKIEFFIRACKYCVELHNFNAAHTIFAALGSLAVDRLQTAWREVGRKHLKTMDEIGDLFAVRSMYRVYRNVLQKTTLPAIPTIQIISHNIFALEEGNPDFTDSELVNLDKFRMIYSIMKQCVKFQQGKYQFPMEETFYILFEQLCHLTESEIEAKSKLIEPSMYN